QGGVSEEFEERAMICVAAGFGEHVDLSALMPELRGENADLNLELLNRINRGKRDIRIEVRVGVIDAVERVVVEHDALPARRYRLGGAVATLPRTGLPRGRRQSVHVRRERNKPQI